MFMPQRFLNNNPDVITIIMTYFAVYHITLSDVEMWFKILSFAVAIIYTIFKGCIEWAKFKHETRDKK